MRKYEEQREERRKEERQDLRKRKNESSEEEGVKGREKWWRYLTENHTMKICGSVEIMTGDKYRKKGKRIGDKKGNEKYLTREEIKGVIKG